MEPSTFDRFLRDIAGRSSRRGLGGLTVGALASLALSHETQAKKKKKKGKKVEICHEGRSILVSSKAVKSHLRHGDSVGPCPTPPPPPPSPPPPPPPPPPSPPPPPPPPPPIVPGPSCQGGGSGSFGNVRRAAQVFTAGSTGALVSAACTLYDAFEGIIVPGTVYTLDIRALDGSGVPTASVLAAVDVAVEASTDDFFPISGTFPTPAQVTAGTSYAFTITTANANRLWLRIGNNSCPGQLYSDAEANGTFASAGTADVFFTTMMIV